MATNVTVRLAEALGAKDINGDTARALKFLKDAPYEDIVKMQLKLGTPVVMFRFFLTKDQRY